MKIAFASLLLCVYLSLSNWGERWCLVETKIENFVSSVICLRCGLLVVDWARAVHNTRTYMRYFPIVSRQMDWRSVSARVPNVIIRWVENCVYVFLSSHPQAAATQHFHSTGEKNGKCTRRACAYRATNGTISSVRKNHDLSDNFPAHVDDHF